MVTDTDQAVKRVVKMIKENKVESIDGNMIDIQADSICVHGDGEKALDFIKEIRNAFEENDIKIETM